MRNQTFGKIAPLLLITFALSVATALQAQTYEQLAVFNGTNGSYPQAAVVQGLDGNLYGTTKTGGVGDCPGNCGTIFKMTPQGELSTVYEFCKKGGACIDGDYPVAALVLGKDGNFYGITGAGGANGLGTLYEITPGGTFTSLLSFSMNVDGADPGTGLAVGPDGNLYGTATLGGANGAGVGYTVAGGPPGQGTPGMSLLVFDPGNGHTLNSYPLPAATGYPVGVSVGIDRRVVACTSDGQVYGFAPAS